MSFHTYNIAAHNQSLAQVRHLRCERRNAILLAQLRACADLPTDIKALYRLLNTHSGKVRRSVVVKLARQVRKERTAA